MSKQSTNIADEPANAPRTSPVKPRAAFAAASFGNLRAAAGEGQGEPIRILLADIDEDPDQPRTVFKDDELESMAESIKAHGVVQPIVVRPPKNGRYILAFGARRFRASKLAGVADIPAVVRTTSDSNFSAQLIENQQRADLSNSDLAAAIARLAEGGSTNKQIAAICSLKDYQVAAFRQAGSFPPEIAERMDNADMRALYDLFRQWGKTPARVIDALPDRATFISVTEARRIIGAITGKPTGSIVLDREKIPSPSPALVPALVPAIDGGRASGGEREAPGAGSAEGSSESSRARAKDGAGEPQITSKPNAVPDRLDKAQAHHQEPGGAPRPHDSPVFVVIAGDEKEAGRLVVNQRARKAGLALVAYSTGIEEVDVSLLRIVRIE
jgi:ParB family chromosome partitioning protein